jgi:hypothetical protein
VGLLDQHQQQAATTVQRYHLIGPKDIKPNKWSGLAAAKWRVSDDENMVVKDSDISKIVGGTPLQSFYAERGVLADAVRKLNAIGSPFILSSGGQQVNAPPSKAGQRKGLQEVVFSHADRAGGVPQSTFRNCDENVRNALGMARPGGTNPGRSVGAVSSVLADQPLNLLDENARFLASDIVSAITRAVAELDANTPRKRSRGGKKKTIPVPGPGESLREWALKHYRTMPDAIRTEVARAFGINEAATPEVGEAVGIVNPATQLGHFFPAVAKSGHDWVSLENDTDQKGGGSAEENTAWYYRMYGPSEGKSDQTPFGEAKKSGAYGKVPLVFKIVPLETLKSPHDCDRVALDQFTKGTRQLQKSDHSFGYSGLDEVEGVKRLRKVFAEVLDALNSDEQPSISDLLLEVSAWNVAGQKILAAAPSEMKKKMAQRGLNTINQLLAVLKAIGNKRDELSPEED